MWEVVRKGLMLHSVWLHLHRDGQVHTCLWPEGRLEIHFYSHLIKYTPELTGLLGQNYHSAGLTPHPVVLLPPQPRPPLFPRDDESLPSHAPCFPCGRPLASAREPPLMQALASYHFPFQPTHHVLCSFISVLCQHPPCVKHCAPAVGNKTPSRYLQSSGRIIYTYMHAHTRTCNVYVWCLLLRSTFDDPLSWKEMNKTMASRLKKSICVHASHCSKNWGGLKPPSSHIHLLF